MRKLLICQHDPNCAWSRIADAPVDPRAYEARDRHYLMHANKDARDRRRRERELAWRREQGHTGKGAGEEAPAPSFPTCWFCQRGTGRGHDHIKAGA